MGGRACSPGWHGVELRHLITLQAVASERSFSAAAARLGYTQSAISGHILALERVIGARVFERIRGSRPAQPTPEGRVLLAHADAIVARLEAAHEEIRALQSGASRALRIGSSPLVSPLVVPSALAGLEGDVELVHEDTEWLLQALEKGRLDVALVPLPIRAGPFAVTELYRDDDVFVVRRGEHPTGPVVVLGSSPAEAILDLDVVRRVDDAGVLLAFVSSGSAVGLLPSRSVELPAALAYVRIDPGVPQRGVAAVWNEDLSQPERVHRFVDLAAHASKPSLKRVS